MKVISTLTAPFTSNKDKKDKKKNNNKSDAVARSDRPTSFGSHTTYSSSSSDDSVSTPKSVLGQPVTRRELESVLRRLGPDPPRDDEVAAMLAEAADLDGIIGPAEADPDELRAAFGVFDANGDGRISAEELMGLFAALGEGDGCTIEDCRRMIGLVDSNGDGFVCFQDFARMMDPAKSDPR